jgi:hypothetical protein
MAVLSRVENRSSRPQRFPEFLYFFFVRPIGFKYSKGCILPIFCSYIAIICGVLLFVSSTGQAQEYVPGEVIVKFKKEQAGSANFSSKAIGLSVNLKKSWNLLNTHHFQAKAGQQNVEQLVQQLRADPNVEYAEPNYIFKKQSVGLGSNKFSKSEAMSAISTS